jgi:hypothetical protein
VAGQAVTVSGVTFTESSQNPQITVQIQSPRLPVFFAGAIGITSGRTVVATATAEAYNPSGQSSGQRFCTACVRPWLIPNCDPSPAHSGSLQNPNCPPLAGSTSNSPPKQVYLLGPGRSHPLENPACYPSGVIGETIPIAVETQQTQFGAVDDGTGLAGYQKSIVTCNTGQMTCGSVVNTLPGSKITATTPGINTLLHVASGNIGPNQGQDWIDTTVCPPQIHAGASNPLVIQGVLAQDALVATSDSIVTVYLYDGPGLSTNTSQSVTVLGFVQIFVTQQDQNGDVWGVILGLAGCATGDTDCDPGAFQGSTMLPVRLITPAGS